MALPRGLSGVGEAKQARSDEQDERIRCGPWRVKVIHAEGTHPARHAEGLGEDPQVRPERLLSIVPCDRDEEHQPGHGHRAAQEEAQRLREHLGERDW